MGAAGSVDLLAAAHLAGKAGDHLKAVALFHDYLAIHPTDVKALFAFGIACFRAGHPAEAERAFRICLQQAEGAALWNNLAITLSAQNKLPEARQACERALAIDADHAETWHTLAEMHRFRAGDPLLQMLRKQVKRKTGTLQDRRLLCFAYAKAQNDLGNWDAAFRYAQTGADLLAPAFDPATQDHAAESIRAAFSREVMTPVPGRGSETDVPVFVVGMPRSGTTLLSQMLAGSRQIASAGEVGTVRSIAKSWAGSGGKISQAQVKADAARYLEDLSRLSGRSGARHIVDKMPGNLFHLGVISVMFPKAKVIFLERDPHDLAVSNFFAQFSEGHEDKFRLDWLGGSILRARRTAQHFQETLPNPWMVLSYEDLVTRPEPVMRAVLGFLDMPWDAGCLRPDEAGGNVLTASVIQVRAKINTGSIGRWRRYRAHLGPLFDVLGDPDQCDAA